MPYPIASPRADIGLAPLGLICACLAVLALQLLIPLSDVPPSRFHPRPRIVNTPPVKEVGDYPQITARPLFTPTRSANDSGLAPINAQLSDYAVLGTAMSGGVGVVIVRGPGGQANSLRVGDALLGSRLTAIGRDAIVLEGPDGRHTLAVTGGAALAPGANR